MSIIIAQFLVFRDIFHFEEIFNNFFVVDSFGSFMKSLLLIGSGIIIYIFLINEKNQTLNKIEFPILIVISLIGMMLMVSANDLLSLFLSIELQSLALYILVSFDRKNLFSSEAGVKYFVIGSLSTCIFLFGCSLIYGSFGTTNFSEIADLISQLSEIPLPIICFFVCKLMKSISLFT